MTTEADSFASTSVDDGADIPLCASARARELYEFALTKLLMLALGATVAAQGAALWAALALPPLLFYLPEVAP